MILRRLAEGIRKQDWFTVLVEFVIVVAGIFVALQVDNWNESRLQRVQERAMLERLLVEAQKSVAYIDNEISRSAGLIEAQRQMLEIVFSEAPVPADTSEAQLGFVTLNFFPAMAPPRSIYDELTSTGGLRLIQSPAVRDAISAYYATVDFFLAQLSYFRDFSISTGNDPTIVAGEFVRGVYEPEDEFGRRYIIDWQGLRTSQPVRTLFVDKLRNQIVMNQNRERLRESAQEMCEAIAREIDNHCVPPAMETSHAY